MTQIVVVNGMTAHRANVIARHTGSAAMGVVKAQMIDLLKAITKIKKRKILSKIPLR